MRAGSNTAFAVACVFCIAMLGGCDSGKNAGAPSASPSVTPSTTSPSPSASPSPTPSPSASASPAKANTTPCGSASAKHLIRFRVYVQPGLATTAAAFRDDVRAILCHPRGWIASGVVRFAYSPNASLLIGLRSARETERRCQRLIHSSVNYLYSCGTPKEEVINADRWFGGAPWGWAPRAGYRQMLISHETGHAMYLNHQVCERDGDLGAVMMQQSKGMTSPNGKTCRRNPYPLASELRRLARTLG